MHVISRPTLVAAAKEHPDAADWLNRWWQDAKHARWEKLDDVRLNYPSADRVKCCLIFDARGNRYRLICRVTFPNEWQRGTLLVKHFLRHAEYDRGRWKEDCE